MNVEELATLWHFPIEGVAKNTFVQMASGRKAEPPGTLPRADELVGEDKAEPLFLGDIDEEDENDPLFIPDQKSTKNDQAKKDEGAADDIFSRSSELEDEKGGPPSNLPFA